MFLKVKNLIWWSAQKPKVTQGPDPAYIMKLSNALHELMDAIEEELPKHKRNPKKMAEVRSAVKALDALFNELPYHFSPQAMAAIGNDNRYGR